MDLRKLLSILHGEWMDLEDSTFLDLIQKAPDSEVSRFYRGDDRTPEVIEEKGFVPFENAKEEDKIHFLNAICKLKKNELLDFVGWNQIRDHREMAETGRYFVSTSLTDCQKGHYAYIIDGLQMSFYDIKKLPGGMFSLGIAILNESESIRAIKLNDNEVLFLDTIPPKFIKHI